jgi:hypothetical protein
VVNKEILRVESAGLCPTQCSNPALPTRYKIREIAKRLKAAEMKKLFVDFPN